MLFFMFVKLNLEATASLTHISFLAIGAFLFVHSGLGVYISGAAVCVLVSAGQCCWFEMQSLNWFF